MIFNKFYIFMNEVHSTISTMRTVLITLTAYCVLVFLLISCKKDKVTEPKLCLDGNAINYQREGYCVYLSDVFHGEYEAKLLDVDGELPGFGFHDSYDMAFGSGGSCRFSGVPDYNSMSWSNVRQGNFLNDGACFYIKGASIYIDFARLGSDFYLGAFKGQGTFSEKGFVITGEYIENWTKEKHTLTLKGTRIVHD